MPFLAHTGPSASGKPEPLEAHLQDVGRRAGEFAGAFEAADEAWIAGLLHDLGKYGDLFQRRLQGKEHGIDHWSAGAWVALQTYRTQGIAAALAIQGHHIGLQQASKDSLSLLNPASLSQSHPLGLRLSSADLDPLVQRFKDSKLALPRSPAAPSVYGGLSAPPAAAMLDVRMLFSALVDADFIETEAHFQQAADGSKHYRNPGPALEYERDLAILQRHQKQIADNSDASLEVTRLRADLLHACLDAASLPQGVFSLTAPTGSGKTLSMLAFALKHAREHTLRRIVVVVPYLTIIEQTVREYRKVLEPHLGRDLSQQYILEHHSLAGTRPRNGGAPPGERDDEGELKRRIRELSENWDAPIIITTSVQFLESLFANHSAACRKLHRLAQSVVLFDEVQTLPISLAVPTLATLSHLAARYRTTVVFATATQPAFVQLDEYVKKFSTTGWESHEVVPQSLGLSRRVKRTRVAWPDDLDHPKSWEELAIELAAAREGQVLCILNLKRHALTVYSELKKRGIPELFHLSTNMCPAHREATLAKVRGLLDHELPCRLISTQCVEAGVDLDFPVVYRAFGPFDAIVQAAGRCNRRGRLAQGTVHVFLPEEEVYPDPAYRQAAAVSRVLLQKHGLAQLDIDDPELATEYYRELYNLTRPADRKQELTEALKRQDFVAVAAQYRIIDQDAINVLVPYDLPAFNQLAEDVRESRLNAAWIRRARPHTIGLFRPKPDAPIRGYLEAVPVGRNATGDDWFIYLDPKHYDAGTGLVPPVSPECLIA
jgi:CRISPR-associated helicase Cas3/CRISPR-associated endonuclease Cas3-HD